MVDRGLLANRFMGQPSTACRCLIREAYHFPRVFTPILRPNGHGSDFRCRIVLDVPASKGKTQSHSSSPHDRAGHRNLENPPQGGAWNVCTHTQKLDTIVTVLIVGDD
jgi:hypothetical protein